MDGGPPGALGCGLSLPGGANETALVPLGRDNLLPTVTGGYRLGNAHVMYLPSVLSMCLIIYVFCYLYSHVPPYRWFGEKINKFQVSS